MFDSALGIFEGLDEFEDRSTDFDLTDKGVNFWDDDPWTRLASTRSYAH